MKKIEDSILFNVYSIQLKLIQTQLASNYYWPKKTLLSLCWIPVITAQQSCNYLEIHDYIILLAVDHMYVESIQIPFSDIVGKNYLTALFL